jgi:hypothetical protein
MHMASNKKKAGYKYKGRTVYISKKSGKHYTMNAKGFPEYVPAKKKKSGKKTSSKKKNPGNPKPKTLGGKRMAKEKTVRNGNKKGKINLLEVGGLTGAGYSMINVASVQSGRGRGIGSNIIYSTTGIDIDEGGINDFWTWLTRFGTTHGIAAVGEGLHQLYGAPKGIAGSGIGFKLNAKLFKGRKFGL